MSSKSAKGVNMNVNIKSLQLPGGQNVRMSLVQTPDYYQVIFKKGNFIISIVEVQILVDGFKILDSWVMSTYSKLFSFFQEQSVISIFSSITGD